MRNARRIERFPAAGMTAMPTTIRSKTRQGSRKKASLRTNSRTPISRTKTASTIRSIRMMSRPAVSIARSLVSRPSVTALITIRTMIVRSKWGESTRRRRRSRSGEDMGQVAPDEVRSMAVPGCRDGRSESSPPRRAWRIGPEPRTRAPDSGRARRRPCVAKTPLGSRSSVLSLSACSCLSFCRRARCRQPERMRAKLGISSIGAARSSQRWT